MGRLSLRGMALRFLLFWCIVVRVAPGATLSVGIQDPDRPNIHDGVNRHPYGQDTLFTASVLLLFGEWDAGGPTVEWRIDGELVSSEQCFEWSLDEGTYSVELYVQGWTTAGEVLTGGCCH